MGQINQHKSGFVELDDYNINQALLNWMNIFF